MAITWNTPTQPVATGSGSGIKWNNPTPAPPSGQTPLGASQGVLGHSQSMLDTLTNAAKGVGDFASGIMPGIAKSVGATVKQASDFGQTVGAAGTNAAIHGANALTGGHVPDMQADYLPEVDQALQPHGAGEQTGNVIGTVGQFLGSGGLDLAKGAVGAVKAIPAAFDAVKAEGIGGLLSKGFQGAKTAIQDAQAARNAKATINAVNPDLSGAKLTKASGQIMTGGRELTPKSMFHEQTLTPDQKTINLGSRLKELNLSAAKSDAPKNLEALRSNMDSTESQLQTKLGDPNVVNLNADKQGLMTKLDSALNEAPTEHRIKDTEGMMGHVVDYAKGLVNDAKLNFQGLRDAKTNFYSGAQKEFPSAFSTAGTIDTKTPAGYAIQKVGEVMSQHLYETSPEGSDIQKLIGREADLFRANQNIAPKAAQEFKDAIDAKDEGKIAELKAKYPKTWNTLKYGLEAAGADLILKKTTGLGI